MAKRPMSKAEKERREYIRETAQATAAEVLQILYSEEMKLAKEAMLFQDAKAYRNQGALQLAKILCDLEPAQMVWAIHQVVVAGQKGGFNCVRVRGRDVYPLPLE